jgi:hypothetical protein
MILQSSIATLPGGAAKIMIVGRAEVISILPADRAVNAVERKMRV